MTQHIEDGLREAFGPDRGCPAPESFLKDSLDAMSTGERERVQSHAEQCPACAAEREMARAFDAGSEPSAEADPDVDFVTSHLRSPVAAPIPTRSVRHPGRSWLAAAAMLFVAVLGSIYTLRSPAPILPPRGEDTVVRGGRIELSAPLGEIDAVPRTLRWEAVKNAANYDVRVLAVDDTVLFAYRVGDVTVDLPDDVRARLHPAVIYFWEVEALDTEGNRLVASERAQFRVRPGARGGTIER